MVPADVDREAHVVEGEQLPARHAPQLRELGRVPAEHAGTDPLLAEFQKTDPATGKPYTQDFGWLNHTWDHAYLDAGCATQNYIEAELNAEHELRSTSAPGATTGTGGLGLTASTDPSQPYGTENPHAFVPGGHSGLADLVMGMHDAVDPPTIDDATPNATGGDASPPAATSTR